MKALKAKYIMLLMAALCILTSNAFAQQTRMPPGDMEKQRMPGMNHEKHMPMIPDLTDMQREQIDKLRTEHLKVMLPLKNQVTEKEAKLQTLSTAENIDMKAINKLIEEIGQVKIKMMKEQAVQHQKIRKLLTESQRLVFDTRSHPEVRPDWR